MEIRTVRLDDEKKILSTFEYHRPSDEQIYRIAGNRRAFRAAAEAILSNCRQCADRTAALRQLHEAMMTANKAIACESGTPPEA